MLLVGMVPIPQAMTGTTFGHLLWYVWFCLWFFRLLFWFVFVFWKDFVEWPGLALNLVCSSGGLKPPILGAAMPCLHHQAQDTDVKLLFFKVLQPWE